MIAIQICRPTWGRFWNFFFSFFALLLCFPCSIKYNIKYESYSAAGRSTFAATQSAMTYEGAVNAVLPPFMAKNTKTFSPILFNLQRSECRLEIHYTHLHILVIKVCLN